jgi:hypothetical protein
MGSNPASHKVQSHNATARKEEAKERLKESIARYRANPGNYLDEEDGKFLDRLAANPDAADTFAAILPDDGWRNHWHKLLWFCIAAVRRARTHKEQISGLQDQLNKIPRAIKSVETLDEFFRGHSFGPSDPVWTAIALLRARIDAAARADKAHLNTFSRKKDTLAAQSAGIGLLREKVRHLSGRANDKHVIVLAQIIFHTDKIEIDNVRKAVMPHDPLRGRRIAKSGPFD